MGGGEGGGDAERRGGESRLAFVVLDFAPQVNTNSTAGGARSEAPEEEEEEIPPGPECLYFVDGALAANDV